VDRQSCASGRQPLRCDGCGRSCWRNELERSGLRWYCRVCLANAQAAQPVLKKTEDKTCYICNGLGDCPECEGE